MGADVRLIVEVMSARRTLLVLGTSFVVGLTVAVVSSGASSESPLRALMRPGVASDALPYKPGIIVGQVLRSRRVATYTDRGGRSTDLFVYEVKGHPRHGATNDRVWFCMFLLSQGAGGFSGCGPSQDLSQTLAKHPLDVGWGTNAYDGEYVYGVAARSVRRVVLTESNGVKRNVALSADDGFVYDCGANGCGGSIYSYDQHGQLLSAQRLPPFGK